MVKPWALIKSAAMAALALALASLPSSALLRPWQIYTFHDGSFRLAASSIHPLFIPRSSSRPVTQPPHTLVDQPTWHITASALADVTGDGLAEWVLIVWRPWRDWPIQQWSTVISPIAGFHDSAGSSCHLILIDPRDGRQVWAGSALPAPLLALAVGDVDGDTRSEIVTLEGDYATGHSGPATHVDVWEWNGFGFTLEWRSPPGILHQLWLNDAEGDGIPDIVVH
jgi:hypothetical protein